MPRFDEVDEALKCIESVTITVHGGCQIYEAARAAFGVGELLHCGRDGAKFKFNDRLYNVLLWYDQIDPKTGHVIPETDSHPDSNLIAELHREIENLRDDLRTADRDLRQARNILEAKSIKEVKDDG